MSTPLLSRRLSTTAATLVRRQYQHQNLRSPPFTFRIVTNASPKNFARTYFRKQPFSAEPAVTEEDAVAVPVTYVYPDGEEVEVQAEIGNNLLEIAKDNDIDLEGACGGELACATCHLVFEQDVYDQLPEKLEEEDDMLDLAYELTDTSRLGCQIKVTKDMEGMRVHVPEDGV